MTRLTKVLVALGLVVAFGVPAAAQDVKIQRSPLERELGIIPPTTEPARSRPADAEHYPSTGGIIHDPAFFEALSAKTETGRYGLAGWSAPNSPAGPDYREINGWPSFGFAFTWSSAPVGRKRPGNANESPAHDPRWSQRAPRSP
ncbi:MAG: hypothetical protein ACREKS_17240 [Candidatus Rokuibacteriota bacterium]